MLLVACRNAAKRKMRFLVQPYVLKPNGNVFDEIRNFFIDGEWAYSVYTDGVDYEGFWEQPEGKLKEACKKLPGFNWGFMRFSLWVFYSQFVWQVFFCLIFEVPPRSKPSTAKKPILGTQNRQILRWNRTCRLAIRTMEEVKKVHKWEGKPLNSLLNRIDIGVVPDKSKKEGRRIFVNEIEPQMTTWLGRYCPFVVQDKIAEVCVKQIREMLKRSLAAKRKMPSPEKVRKLLAILDQRLWGEIQHIQKAVSTGWLLIAVKDDGRGRYLTQLEQGMYQQSVSLRQFCVELHFSQLQKRVDARALQNLHQI